MIKKVCLLILITLGFFSCGKSGDVVPNVAVNFQADVNDPRLAALHTPGGAVIIPGYGVAGLLIYREPDLSYAAYDACSSYMPQNHCTVTIDKNTITCTDPCSGSKFLYDLPRSTYCRSYNLPACIISPPLTRLFHP